MARLGKFQVTGLDISRTMVEIATESAQRAGVQVDFRHGDAAAMPFADQSFDLIICQAAFKNFPKPLAAINGMHRVLRPGGTAVIHDMTHEASGAAISEEVRGMHLPWLPSLMTRVSLVGLRRRAYTPAQFSQLAQHSAFLGCDIKTAGIGMAIRMTKGAGR